jgi:zinc transporter ZupT
MNSRLGVWMSALVPLVLLGALLAVFWRSSGGLRFDAPAPVEQVAFERVVFRPNEIIAHVRNVGPEEVTVAQVQVGWMNRASWNFSVEPSPTIPRLSTARVRIPYPWVAGEPYEVVVFTANGLAFAHDVAVATDTPEVNLPNFAAYAALGIYVGVIPVCLGVMWLPFLRQLGQASYGFLLSLTVGLLVFLGVDSLSDALEAGAELPGAFQGVGLTLIGVSISLYGLWTLTQRLEARQTTTGREMALPLAYLVALGIGVHNLGEGLAIGGAYALGEVATGALLIIGFTIHNLTEGIAVVSPIARSRMGKKSGGASWWHLAWLGALAGLPTILGTSLGAFAPSPVFAVLFLAVGAGAIFQVVFQIVRQMQTSGSVSLATPAHLAGFLSGLGLMYITGLFVAV